MKHDPHLFFSLSDPTPETVIEFMKQYSDDKSKWYEWEWKTIKEEIGSVYSEHRAGLIMSVAALLNQSHGEYATFSQWRDPAIFTPTCTQFSGVTASFEYLNVCTLGQVLYALHVFDSVKKYKLSEELNKFIAISLFNQGILYVPKRNSINKEIFKLLDNDSKKIMLKTEKLYNKAISKISETDAVSLQILKIKAGLKYSKDRIKLSKKQIESIK